MTFLLKICPKRKLGFQIQEADVEIRISILEIPCILILKKKWTTLSFCLKNAKLGPNLPKKWILGSKFEKSKSGFGISILEIL